jgi:hypothetical protein
MPEPVPTNISKLLARLSEIEELIRHLTSVGRMHRALVLALSIQTNATTKRVAVFVGRVIAAINCLDDGTLLPEDGRLQEALKELRNELRSQQILSQSSGLARAEKSTRF